MVHKGARSKQIFLEIYTRGNLCSDDIVGVHHGRNGWVDLHYFSEDGQIITYNKQSTVGRP